VTVKMQLAAHSKHSCMHKQYP